jgi:hypothetical protein
MQDETNSPARPDPDDAERMVLLLLSTQLGRSLWSRREIATALGSAVDAADGVAGLHAAGLVHCIDEFVFLSQSALRARQLEEAP